MSQVFLPTRRAVLAGALLVTVSGVLFESRSRAAAGVGFQFLEPHQVEVLVEATARLVPGPLDELAEAGHPGAREADVVRYVDTLLSAFEENPPKVFAGGPWSNRHTTGPDLMADFVPLEERQLLAWRARVAELRRSVPAAVVALDEAAKGDGFAGFVAAPTPVQDEILSSLKEVRDLLFDLTIQGMYSVPEYGGNAGLVGWKEIKWRGDVQPAGYSKAEVEGDDGLDPVGVNDLLVVQELLALLPPIGTTRHG